MKQMVLILVGFLMFSCDKEINPLPMHNELEGEWELTRVECYCFFNEDTNFSQTVIKFNTSNSELTVVNKEDYNFFKKAGVYSYTVQDSLLSFGDDNAYRFQVKDAVLTLDYIDVPEIADDEVSFYFKFKE